MSMKMLKGIDYYHPFLLDEIITGNKNDPLAISFYVGWIVIGSFKQFQMTNLALNNFST